MWASFILGLGAGVAATPHCLGMCGGFPLHLAKHSHEKMALLRQILFVLGKSSTYAFLGAIASSLGVILLKDTALESAGPLLRVVAGSLTVLFGLLMLGIRLPPIRSLQGISDSGSVRALLGGLLTSPGPTAAFVLGLGVGFLPCPLPLGMLAVAAGSQHVIHGIALMAGVGLGTAPGLLVLGLFGIGLDRRFARIGMKAAGAVVICIGVLTIARAATMGHVVPPCCGGER